jgi:hypothetical protein
VIPKTLPRKVKVGDKWYSVEIMEAMKNKNEAGRVYYDEQRIELGKRGYHGVPLRLHAIHETFWHELVHAILHDMEEHKLNDREKFVEDFAYRLYKAIRSARF